jgi:hypothetical protein
MIELYESQVQILRKRDNSNEGCDPDENDDDKFMKTVMKRANCTPPFWISMVTKGNTYPACSTAKQLQKMNDILKKIANILNMFREYTEPCDTLSSIITFQEMHKNTDNDPTSLFLVFNHMEEMYQEIVNKREFGPEMLWSTVGGLVGMFLGFSFWQSPEILENSNILQRAKMLYHQSPLKSLVD